MRQTLQITDNFLPAGVAAALRAECLGLPFGDREYKGETYPNIALLSPEWNVIVGGQLEMAMGCRIKLHLSFLRYSVAGDPTPQWIHADNGEAEYAAVFYLSEPTGPEDGTAFWRHIESSDDHARPDLTEAEVAMLNAEGHRDRAWERSGLAKQVFNRLIVYPTDLFHSRFPQESSGHDVATGRLIWVAFFDKA